MIHVKNLRKYFGSSLVLRDINVEITSGDVVAIIGPSGSGKSTFLRCLNGLETVQTGEIYINGTHLTEETLPLIRRQVGMVFQNFHLFPHMTVLDNITFAPIRVLGVPKDQAQEEAVALLQQVGLVEKVSAFPGQLSGGQKQRVAIARTLATRPELVLFDEPTSALDPEMVAEVLAVIRGLAHTGITILLVTHEMGFARDMADRVLFMDHGQIIEDSLPSMFFQSPKTERAQRFLAKVLP